MAEETRKIKMGENHVSSRYVPGGYSRLTEYVVSKREAKELTDAKLATYAGGSKAKALKAEDTGGVGPAATTKEKE